MEQRHKKRPHHACLDKVLDVAHHMNDWSSILSVVILFSCFREQYSSKLEQGEANTSASIVKPSGYDYCMLSTGSGIAYSY
jgi:hypothetical protein